MDVDRVKGFGHVKCGEDCFLGFFLSNSVFMVLFFWKRCVDGLAGLCSW